MTTDSMLLGDLARPAMELPGTTPCSEIDVVFGKDPGLTSIVLHTRDGLALLDRSDFEFKMSGARGFGRWLHGANAVEDAIDLSRTLRLNASTTLQEAYRSMLRRSGKQRFHDILVVGSVQVRTVRVATLLEAVARVHAREALRDTLTGLGNRTLLTERVAEALNERPEDVALLFIDFDRFKVVNDSLGHEAGDVLLVQFAQRLISCVGPLGIPARLGGDEFAVLVNDETGEAATRIAASVVDALREPFAVGTQGVVMNASVGITTAAPGDDAAALLRKADLAMYQAKRSGGARFQYFRGDLERAAHERLETEVWLRHALEDGEGLELHYQPIVELETGELTGFEALIRGRHPVRGLLAPADFLEVAEETGMINSLDMWVLRKACLQLGEWNARLSRNRPLTVNVNLSAKHLDRSGVGSDVATVIRETGVAPELVEIEITETSMVRSVRQAILSLNQLRGLGVRIAIDDFGTGYSSLNHLSKLPLDALKVDASFVARAVTNKQDAAIVRLIIALARAMEVDAIAEGIEDREQAELLAEFGCPRAQGYYFARPLTVAQVDTLFARGDVVILPCHETSSTDDIEAALAA